MKSGIREFAAILSVMALVYPAAYAQQQPQAPPPPQQQNPPAQTAPATTPAPAAAPQDQQQDQTAPADATASPADTAPGQDNGATPSKVKSGSEADVNAIGNRKVGHGPEMYSMEHEIALGKQLAQEVDRVSKFITDPVVTEYVNRVAQNIVRNSDAQVPFTIKVIDSDAVNAFALPGGFFYV
ncbi:MAG TPA: hypothetical protein VEJ39_09005, partial [Candidatus Acidoferrales bacterium]|nr:hypothetical protein [Candidatus Acidoferrales bacterium]